MPHAGAPVTLLAIETATSEVGVALGAGDVVLASATARPGRRHVETLHPLIAEVTTRAGVALGDLAAVAVDVGPGLFTGLRVGVAAAKALAFALGRPLVALSSTDVLLHAARHAPGAVAVVDLRRGELAWADAPGRLPERGGVEDLVAALSRRAGAALLVGDGALRYAQALSAVAEIGGEEFAAPPVGALARLAGERFATGETVDPFALEPVYLRDADVRINWTTRERDLRAGPGEVA